MFVSEKTGPAGLGSGRDKAEECEMVMQLGDE